MEDCKMSLPLEVIGPTDLRLSETAVPMATAFPSWTSELDEYLRLDVRRGGSRSVVWRNGAGLKRIEIRASHFTADDERDHGRGKEPAASGEGAPSGPQEEEMSELDLRWSATLTRFFAGDTLAPVVLDGMFVKVVTSTGQVYECPLPSRVQEPAQFRSVYPLPIGAVFRVDASDGIQYFVMSHPLQDMGAITEFTAGDRIVFSSRDLPLLATYNASSRSYRIWSLRYKLPSKERTGTDPSSSCSSSGNSNDVYKDTRKRILGKPKLLLLWEEKLTTDGDAPRDANLYGQGFLAHDADGRLLVNFVLHQTLVMLAVFAVKNADPALMSVERLEETCRLPNILAATGVVARRPGHLDILCLEADKNLSLRFGRHVYATCHLSPRIDCRDFLDPVGCRVSVLDAKGRLLRVSCEVARCSNALTAVCLSACEVAMSPAAYAELLQSMYRARFAEEDASPALGEWSALCAVLLGMSRLDLGAYTAATKETETPSSEWESFLRAETTPGEAEAEELFLLVRSLPRRRGVQRRDDERIKATVRCLHLVYEDHRLSVLGAPQLPRLGALITLLAASSGEIALCDRYCRQLGPEILHPAFAPLLVVGDKDALKTSAKAPHHVDVFHWLSRCLELPGGLDMYPLLRAADTSRSDLAFARTRSPIELTEKLVHTVLELAQDAGGGDDGASRSVDRAVRAMVSHGFGPSEVESLQFGPRLVVADGLLVGRASPRSSWPVEAYELVGREDLSIAMAAATNAATNGGGGGASLGRTSVIKINAEAVAVQARQAKAATREASEPAAKSAPIGGTAASKASSVAGTRSGREPDGCEIADPALKLRFGADRRLDEVRRLLQSSEPVAIRAQEGFEVDPGDPHQQALFALKLMRSLAAGVGRGAFVLHTYSPPDPTEKLCVPRISLAGRLVHQKGALVNLENNVLLEGQLDWPDFHNGAAAGLRVVKGNGDIITRTWIVYNKPREESGTTTYAGVLLALGISGHLPSLRVTDWYQHLLPRHELTSLALMLGIGACNCRTMYPVASKLLCLHVRHFNSAGFSQADWNVSRLVQSAAVVGLGLLYMGSSDRVIAEGMMVELTRRPSPSENPQGREGLALAAGLALGMVCLGNGGRAKALSDLQLEERLSHYVTGGPKEAPAETVGDAQTDLDTDPQLVKEADSIDIDVTAPGAILALALMYLKTNDASVLKWLPLPETRFGLQLVRPHHVLLLVLARSLIMWDSIQPTEAWIVDQLPEVVREDLDKEDVCKYMHSAVRKGRREDHSEEERLRQEGVKDRQQGSGSRPPPGMADHDDDDDQLNGKSEGSHEESEVRVMAICGACMAIGLRFAGSADPRAFSLLLSALRKGFGKGLGTTFELCTNATALAIAMVMAGTGNLEVLRELRRLRVRSVRYGSQLAMGMAIGILFLGGGGLTLNNSSEAVAALLCAIYPRFPIDPQDNRYHLQALRHLYALAACSRLLEAREVDTGANAYVPVKIQVKGASKEIDAVTPCLLPHLDLVESVSVSSPRYWPLELKELGTVNERKTLFVKRKAAHLPYADDPKGVEGILARSLGGFRVDVSGFSVDPVALSFMKAMCNEGDRVSFYESILHDSLARDKPDLVKLFLEMEKVSPSTSIHFQRALYQSSMDLLETHLAVQGGTSPLVHPHFHARMRLRADLCADSPPPGAEA